MSGWINVLSEVFSPGLLVGAAVVQVSGHWSAAVLVGVAVTILNVRLMLLNAKADAATTYP